MATNISKFGIEIEFKGLGSNTYTVQNRLRTIAAEIGFDIDIQSEGYNHATRAWWKVVTDASVQGGAELVSPPLPMTEESFEVVRKVFDLLQRAGARVDQQCGTHVHLDASFLRNLSNKKILDFFTVFVGVFKATESQFDKLVKSHRVNTRFASRMAGKPSENIVHDRYHKVNLACAYERHKTIEFRQLHGTLNGEAVVAWVKLCKVFTENTYEYYQTRVTLSQRLAS